MSISGVPTVDLHNHISGAIGPETALRMAARKGLKLPREIFREDAEGRPHFRFRNFDEFVGIFAALNPLLSTPIDYYEVVSDYLTQVAAENCLLCEFMVSPTSLARVPETEEHFDPNGPRLDPGRYRDFLDAIRQAGDEARARYGTEVRLSATGIRHYGPDLALAGARFLADNPDPLMTSYGLAGTERNYFMEDFAPAFAAAKQGGLVLRTHAGELRGPASVQAALDALDVTIIDHGIRSIEDPGLVRRLADQQTLITVCLTSNKMLMPQYQGAAFEAHPVRKLYDAGVPMSLGSDDPGLFDTTAGAEQALAKNLFGFDNAALYDTVLSSIANAAIDEPTRGQLLGRAMQVMPPAVAQDLAVQRSTAASPALSERLGRWIDHPDFPGAPAAASHFHRGAPRRRQPRPAAGSPPAFSP